MRVFAFYIWKIIWESKIPSKKLSKFPGCPADALHIGLLGRVSVIREKVQTTCLGYCEEAQFPPKTARNGLIITFYN